MMKLVEEFLSIQGEGIFAGKLAYFIRFAGCNFTCPGFSVKKSKNNKSFKGCDTLRAVYTKDFSDEYSEFSLDRLIQTLNSFSEKPLIIITGGEPFIHQENSEFIELLEYLAKNDYLVQFETNASIKLKNLDVYKNFYFALGIKLKNSQMPKDKRINHEAIQSYLKLSKKAFFKIVISKADIDNDDLDELKQLKSLYKNEEFYLMPLGATNDELSLNAKSVLEYAIMNGFNYTDRVHIRIYNDKEGV